MPMATRTVDPTGSDTDPFSFELDGFELDGERCLELRGRWFGIRGRRFVRPTLVMRIDGERHRLLADLDHKPWAAEEGEAWVASFSPAPPAGHIDEIELSVAPDITISLATPGSRAPSPTVKRAAKKGKNQARPDPPRTNARDLARQLAETTADNARLAAERERVRRDHDLVRARVAELESQLRRTQARAKAALSKAKETLEGERAETKRLRGLLARREEIVADRDRLAGELDAAIAERDRLAAQASQPATVAPEPRPVPRSVTEYRPRRVSAGRRREPAWSVRALALIALCAVLVTLAVVLHLA